MEVAEMAINYVPLTYNGNAGRREEYQCSVDWMEEKRRGGTLLCGLQGKPCCGQYSQCSMQAASACCPICLLLLLLKAFTIYSGKHEPTKPTAFWNPRQECYHNRYNNAF